MTAVDIAEIDVTSPALSAAAVLFDRYRSFYGKPSNLSLAEQYLRERLEAGESTVLLAKLNEEWVGFCQLYPGFSSVSCARTVILNDLYVYDSHRRRGVGRALIDHTFAFAQRVCAERVVLETAQTNVCAQAMYESLGFQRSSGFVSYSLCMCPV